MGCRLCPRLCNADREHGKKGVCGADGTIRIARVAPHYWEEPCISGKNGSGAVFFAGCPLGCVFCQNGRISHGGVGKAYTVEQLAEAFVSLQSKGVHNINLVTPTHYVPQIVSALDIAKPSIPVVYNTGGYDRTETLDLLGKRIKIFLPDYKYFSPKLAQKYSHAEDYPQVALKAIERMLDIAGSPAFDSEGMMKSGVIVRHLVLPGCTDDSMKVLRTLRERFGSSIMVSVMNQYTPTENVPYEQLQRPISDDEYELVLDYADHLGIDCGFRQDGGTVGESFIPPFDEN